MYLATRNRSVCTHCGYITVGISDEAAVEKLEGEYMVRGVNLRPFSESDRTDNLYKTGAWTRGWHRTTSPLKTSNNEDLPSK